MAFDFNVDVRLTDANDPTSVQFINMTIGSAPPGADRLSGDWRGASVLIPADSGEFDWDDRPGMGTAFVFDGPSADARLVLGLLDFRAPGGGLPPRGASGAGSVTDPDDPQFLGDVTWKVT
ncbi:hypothetical protein AB0H71_32680 [Nocardia sp. NPDC050697]|uniref:hypothetical protein n=1 Tax=Nocardia sp. NPDC050697 TaxID=3155158 RepID=UPI003404A00E